jgi:excisionase family DNA binding protein
VSKNTCTTGQAAQRVGITRATLQAWIAKGKIKAPKTKLRDGRAVRLWTESDVAKLKLDKKRLYQQQVGRPRKQKKA